MTLLPQREALGLLLTPSRNIELGYYVILSSSVTFNWEGFHLPSISWITGSKPLCIGFENLSISGSRKSSCP